MIVHTTIDSDIDSDVIGDYFSSLVNKFFKILPMREQEEKTLCTYIDSMQKELIGFGALTEFDKDTSFITLLSILEYFKDFPDADVRDIRREVFRAISICKKSSSIMKGE